MLTLTWFTTKNGLDINVIIFERVHERRVLRGNTKTGRINLYSLTFIGNETIKCVTKFHLLGDKRNLSDANFIR